ncbi:unnamed protein product [Paramecium sonneborni]|uniref:Uncharacterized protein n=1 Tax=Paramecium sonneborni TaxID=65129 RepID=A0A8S1KBA1_9CILI|nr:unnamed protein product [Paramecium sonneborni]
MLKGPSSLINQIQPATLSKELESVKSKQIIAAFASQTQHL